MKIIPDLIMEIQTAPKMSCPTCNGSGEREKEIYTNIYKNVQCYYCKGTGFIDNKLVKQLKELLK